MSFVGVANALTRRAGVGGLAVAGLVAGHCFAYRYFGDAGAHAHHHASHSHAPYFWAVVAGLFVAAVASFVDHRLGVQKDRLATKALALLGAQVSGFLGLSVLDQVAAMPGTEPGSRAFWAGLLLQVLAAALGAVVLALFRTTFEVIDRLTRGDRCTVAREVSSPLVPVRHHVIPALAMADGGPSFRGPPLFTF